MNVATRHRGPMSAAARKHLSAALTGKRHPHKGHALSTAARAKISAALKGRSHPHRGHAMSSAARAKISAALKGKHHVAKKHTATRRRKALATHVRAHLTAHHRRLVAKSRHGHVASVNAVLGVHRVKKTRTPLHHRPRRHHRSPLLHHRISRTVRRLRLRRRRRR